MEDLPAFHHARAATLAQGISVIVPAYNSETSLEELTTRLDAVLRSQSAAFELILVNDGSRDRT
jgi:undecaprenyl-phosphate 4-deoxy-4-formamido-L-arabinose transferase